MKSLSRKINESLNESINEGFKKGDTVTFTFDDPDADSKGNSETGYKNGQKIKAKITYIDNDDVDLKLPNGETWSVSVDQISESLEDINEAKLSDKSAKSVLLGYVENHIGSFKKPEWDKLSKAFKEKHGEDLDDIDFGDLDLKELRQLVSLSEKVTPVEKAKHPEGKKDSESADKLLSAALNESVEDINEAKVQSDKALGKLIRATDDNFHEIRNLILNASNPDYQRIKYLVLMGVAHVSPNTKDRLGEWLKAYKMTAADRDEYRKDQEANEDVNESKSEGLDPSKLVAKKKYAVKDNTGKFIQERYIGKTDVNGKSYYTFQREDDYLDTKSAESVKENVFNLSKMNESLEINEANLEIEVSSKDAKEANEILKDARNIKYENDGSTIFVFKKKSHYEDALDLLKKLEIISESANINESKEIFPKELIAKMKKEGINITGAPKIEKYGVSDKIIIPFNFDGPGGIQTPYKIDKAIKGSKYDNQLSTVDSAEGKIVFHILNESLEINEAKIKSDSEFIEYGEKMLKKAHGDDYDQAKADKTLQGILKDNDGDYGAAVGALQAGMSEEKEEVDESLNEGKDIVVELSDEDDAPKAHKLFDDAKIDYDTYMSDDVLLFDDKDEWKKAKAILDKNKIKYEKQ